MREAFPCAVCGACCRSLDSSPLLAALDRGDGVCRHLDEESNLCGMYDERPEICRVEDMHWHFADHFS